MSLWQLASRLQPDSNELETVNRSASFLTSVIQSKSNESLIPVSLGIYLIGSIARGTKPSPVDDVDLLYVVGEAQSSSNNWHTITKNTFLYSTDDYEPDGNLSSLLLLNRIKKAISSTYPNSDLRRNHEVVNIYLSSYDLSFDLVPAWHITDAGYYLIPQGEQKHKWKKTNPFRDNGILDSLDTKTSSTTKPAILITKQWFKKRQIVTPRSYHLEAITYNILNDMEHSSITLLNTLAMILNNLSYKNLLISCPDPTGLSEPLTSGLMSEDITKITLVGKQAANVLWNDGEFSFLETIDE